MALPEKKHKNVVLNMDGTVSPAQFLRGVKDFFGILRSVSKNVTGKTDGVQWAISVKEGSNLIVADGLPRGTATKEEVMRTIESINTGMDALATGTTEPPKFFTDETLNFAKDLANLAENAKKGGLDKIEFRVNGSGIPVSAEAAASINRIRGKEHVAIGSIEGKLQTVSDRNVFRIVVYDSLHDRSVNCVINDEDILEQAIQAFRKRVTVFGTVRYRKDGTPISVRVSRIRVFRSQDELPPISHIQGIFKRAKMSKQDRYWDSSVFIAFFAEEEGRVDLCRAVIDEAVRGNVRIITSTLAFSEVVHIRGRQRLTQDMEEELRAFFEYDFIVPIVLDRNVSEYARELMWRHTHLRAYDANHLSSAYHAGVNIVDSFDGDFLQLDGQFYGMDGSPIHIGNPSGQVSLDF